MPAVLDHEVSPEQLRLLHKQGLLSDAGLARGLELAAASPPLDAWRGFLSMLLLVMGAALALSGVVFFFAYNWDDLGRFARMSLPAAGIIGCWAVAWAKGLEALTGKVALMGAAVLAGVQIAVYGQTYQTGADAWSLFATWSVLILPWVIAARLPALWVMEVVLLNLAGSLWSAQVLQPDDLSYGLGISLVIASVNLVIWLGWELLAPARPWMQPRWAPRLLAAWVLLPLVTSACSLIFDPGETGLPGPIGFLMLLGACGAMVRLRPGGQRDLFLPTLAAAALIWVADAGLVKVLFDWMDLETLGALLMAGVILAEVAVAIGWLKALRAKELT
jgi:uncharacterized membrane protein